MRIESAFAWGGYIAPWLALGLIAAAGQANAWRWMFAFGALPILMVFIRSRFLPESPRWLIQQGKLDKAEKIVADFEDNARKNNQALPEPVPVAMPPVKKTNFLELFSRQYLGRTLMVFLWTAMTYGYTYGYGPFVAALYVRVGGLPVANAIALTIVSQLISIPFLLLVAFTIDKLGRKFWFGWRCCTARLSWLAAQSSLACLATPVGRCCSASPYC